MINHWTCFVADQIDIILVTDINLWKIINEARNLRLWISWSKPMASTAFALSLSSEMYSKVAIMASYVLAFALRARDLQAHLVSDSLWSSWLLFRMKLLLLFQKKGHGLVETSVPTKNISHIWGANKGWMSSDNHSKQRWRREEKQWVSESNTHA